MRIINDHDIGSLHIHTDLNHRCGYEDINLPVKEALHDRILFLRIHFSMKQCYAIPPSQRGTHPVINFRHVAHIHILIFLNRRADHIALIPFIYFFQHSFQNRTHGTAGYQLCRNRRAPLGKLLNRGHIHIAIQGNRQRTGNRCCTHQQKINLFPFFQHFLSLGNTKTVLLIRNHHTQIIIFHIILKQCVRTDQNINFIMLQALQYILFLCRLQARIQHVNGNVKVRKQPLQICEMLLGKNFRGCHENRLLMCQHTGIQAKGCHHRLSTADIPLHHAVHHLVTG